MNAPLQPPAVRGASLAPGTGAGPAIERFLTLDAMRGMAAIAVLLVHIGVLSGNRWLAPSAFLAVDLFFMISGYVIGFAFEPRLLAGMGWRRFMSLRLARLYPALFLGLLLGLAAAWLAPGEYAVTWRSLGHFLLVPDLFGPGIFPLNGALWTLFFELAINFVHVLVIRQLTTGRLAVFVLIAGAAWAAIAMSWGDWGAGWNGGTFVGGFARVGWGYGAGLLLYRLSRAAPRRLPSVPFLLPLGLAALILMAPPTGFPLLRIAASVFMLIPVAVLLAAAAEVPPLARAPARWLGAVSYPLYAIHLPLLSIAALAIGGRFQLVQWGAAGLACLAFATALAYGYDMPARAYLRSRLATGSEPEGAGRPPASPEETVYSPASELRSPRAFLASAFRDVRRSGDIGWRLFRSELRARRRESLLGHAWLFLPAAATSLVCTYLQRKGIVTLQESQLPYPLFVLSGVLLWQSFTDSLNAPLQQLRSMRQLITRSRVPHEAVMSAGAAGALLNAAIRLAVLLLVLPFFGIPIAPSLLLLPLGFLALILLGLAVGVALAPFGLLYADIGRGLPLATLFWFFLTPVVYPLEGGESWLRLNPVTPLIETSRSWLLSPSLPASFLAVVAGAALGLAAAALLYRLSRPHLIARLG